MDILHHALDPSHDKGDDSNNSDDDGVRLVTHQDVSGEVTDDGDGIAPVSTSPGGLGLDTSMRYQFQADTNSQGQVTYRVVQVAHDGTDTAPQVVTAPGFPPQTVIQAPFSNGGASPPGDGQMETKFAYFPTVAGADGGIISTQSAQDVAAASLGSVAAGGQFYVMMSPQDVLQKPLNIAPRTSFSPKLPGRAARDDRRRATHNEVERRRRDKINNWIVQLSKLVPDCSQEHAKTAQSRGGILAKACDYITELRTANARMADTLKETERLQVDAELLRQQCEELKQENAMLRANLQQHGIVLTDLGGGVS